MEPVVHDFVIQAYIQVSVQGINIWRPPTPVTLPQHDSTATNPLSSSTTMGFCSRSVFQCFKALERLGDKVTGAAGPFFVGLAVILIGTGTVCFCE